ncbi:MAG: THUMP domain-containing protein [Candidatus Methanomethylophilaceae archaeon]
MPLILVRYAEIGLKSRPVRKKFESMLRDNITDMLVRDGVESLISGDEGRLYVECEDPDKTLKALRRVFGVASVSLVELHEGGLREICDAAAEYSQGRLQSGQTFAVRPRREGVHDFTSVDLGREAGSAIFLANEHLGIKVDLNRPDVEFFVEVRQKKAFIFQDYLSGPGGLPLGSQGKVVAVVDDEKGALAAWMMMRRGCKALVMGDGPMELLERYDPKLKRYTGEWAEINQTRGVLGVVYGHTLDQFEKIKESHDPDITAFHPLVGMSKEDIEKMFMGMV